MIHPVGSPSVLVIDGSVDVKGIPRWLDDDLNSLLLLLRRGLFLCLLNGSLTVREANLKNRSGVAQLRTGNLKWCVSVLLLIKYQVVVD